MFVIDAFNGEVIRRFVNVASECGVPMEATISADNKYVLQGNALICSDAFITVALFRMRVCYV